MLAKNSIEERLKTMKDDPLNAAHNSYFFGARNGERRSSG
jgi:hypothetical protein